MVKAEQFVKDVVDPADRNGVNCLIRYVITRSCIEKLKGFSGELIGIEDRGIDPTKPGRFDGDHMRCGGRAKKTLPVIRCCCRMGIIGYPGAVAGQQIIMEQVAGNGEDDIPLDRVKVRRGWAGIEAVDISGFADME